MDFKSGTPEKIHLPNSRLLFIKSTELTDPYKSWDQLIQYINESRLKQCGGHRIIHFDDEEILVGINIIGFPEDAKSQGIEWIDFDKSIVTKTPIHGVLSHMTELTHFIKEFFKGSSGSTRRVVLCFGDGRPESSCEKHSWWFEHWKN
ncbi:MAG: hypothetical protein HOE90_18400 [Bacteriovoracaceae bacterium]|jgi:hypothetical protein|nr:hypothetical protein [Bacteriovoracaceae bacterium]